MQVGKGDFGDQVALEAGLEGLVGRRRWGGVFAWD